MCMCLCAWIKQILKKNERKISALSRELLEPFSIIFCFPVFSQQFFNFQKFTQDVHR